MSLLWGTDQQRVLSESAFTYDNGYLLATVGSKISINKCAIISTYFVQPVSPSSSLVFERLQDTQFYGTLCL